MGILKERDIVNHLYDKWHEYFPELNGCKKEYVHRDSRVDILSSCPVDLYEFGIRSEDDNCRYINAAVFVEVKYNNNDRDLLFELQKHVNFRDWYIKYGKSYCYIVVIADNYDEYMLKYMKEHDILTYKYSLKDEDLSTFKIELYKNEIE